MPNSDAQLVQENDRAPDWGTIVIEEERLKETFTQIPNTVLKRADLSPGAKLTYIGLLSYAWQQDSCFPGQLALARDIGVGERSVRRYLQELQDKKLLGIKRRGLGLTNVYVLLKWDQSSNLIGQNGRSRPAKFAHLDRPNWPANNTQREKDSDIRNSKGKKVEADPRITDQTTSYRINPPQKTSAARGTSPLPDGDGQGRTVYQQIATATSGGAC
jgi:hypothetical protein